MDYLTEIKKLPQEIQDILISPFGAQVNSKIIEKYNLKDDLKLKIINIVNDLYLKRLTLKDLIPYLQKISTINQDKSRQLAMDIVGLKLLIAKDYFGDDLEDCIKNLGGNLDNYNKIVEQEREALNKEKEVYRQNAREEILTSVPFKKLPTVIGPTLTDEKRAAIELFREDLVNLLITDNKDIIEIIDEYNENLIDWLNEDRTFKKDLEKAFYENTEKLTSQPFILDGKPQPPTVANWIRDFIKIEGSDIFNELALSKYLINSTNAKKLNEEEKKLLRKLLILYRNLKFFPESLADLPPEEWEIIPLEKTKEVLTKARTVSAPTQTETKREQAVILSPEPEKEDPLKAASAGASFEKDEELPNISRLISQARKEAEEKLAETTSTPPSIKSMILEEVAIQAERAISELKISISSEEKNRLKNILVSFLKGIRDQIETKDALLKSKEEGGLNFTQRQVEQIFNLIKTEKPREEESPIKKKTFDVSFNEQMKDVLRTPSEDVIEGIGQPVNMKQSQKSQLFQESQESQISPQLQPPPPVILETFREKLKEKIISQPTLSQLSQPSIVSAETRSEPSQPSRPTPPPLPSQMPPIRQVRRIEVPEIKDIKPRLEDIKRSSFSGRKPRVELVGPIEEIRNLTLADFREMSDNPAKVLGKIKEKISLLEKESFLKKIQAIKAWRENEIYQLYLEIGRQVIQERTNLAKTLERRRSQGLPILTEEEISAIMDFNKSIRF